jgi:hypothetical protein
VWAGKSVTKNNIASLIYAAHLRLETAVVSGKTKFTAWKAGFKKCGIFPFNPAAITDEDYAPADAISARIAALRAATTLISQSKPAGPVDAYAETRMVLGPREPDEALITRLEKRSTSHKIKKAVIMSHQEYLAEQLRAEELKEDEEKATKERAQERKAASAQKKVVDAAAAAAVAEFDAATKHPVVEFMPEINPGVMGGTMRLGARATMLRGRADGSACLAQDLYGRELKSEWAGVAAVPAC